MNITKLPSGSYRIRQTVNGRTYSVTTKHRPKKYEAEELIREKIYGAELQRPIKETIRELANDYIVECYETNKSPTTIYSYKSIINNTPSWFLDIRTKEVTHQDIQKVVDAYLVNHSAKSTLNLAGFYKRVFASLSHLNLSAIKLPRKQKPIEYEPTTDDIKAILNYIKGSRYECVINLCCIGLRRGEAIAITPADLNGDVLTINKDIVYDNGKYIVKNTPKTIASNRRIKIPQYVCELVNGSNSAFSGNPHTINAYLHKVQNELNIPQFRLHILRHFAGASLHKNGFTDRQIMAYMGWSSANTLHHVYNYNLDPSESQKDIVDTFNNILG